MTHNTPSTQTKSGRGIIPPLVTPLTPDRVLDKAGLARLVEHVIAGGVHGVFILGTTGEGPALSYGVRKDMIRQTCALVAGRVPVLVGITDTSWEASLEIAETAAQAKATALVAAPPYYFPPAQCELLHYYEMLAKVSPLPFYLYNMPGLTKVGIGEDIIRASLGWDNCLGLKDSSCDMLYYKRALAIAAAKPAYRVLIGPEELLAESMLAGGDGGVSGGANLFPSLYVAIFDAVEKGDFAEASALQKIVLEVSDRLYRAGSYGSPIIQAIKTGLAQRGICGATMSEPFLPFEAALKSRVETAAVDMAAKIERRLGVVSRVA